MGRRAVPTPGSTKRQDVDRPSGEFVIDGPQGEGRPDDVVRRDQMSNIDDAGLRADVVDDALHGGDKVVL